MPRNAKRPAPAPSNPTAPNLTQASVPTGLPYGEHNALVQQIAQTPSPVQPAAPIGGAAPSGGGGTSPPAPAGGGPPDPQAIRNALRNYQAPPLEQIGFRRPTERPNEPVTAGIPIGAGPGPEALMHGGQGAQTPATLRDVLAPMAGSSSQAAYLLSALDAGRT